MTEPRCRHRLEGLEPDNLLAFLALLGLLRALEAARPDWRPRAGWEVDRVGPLRPFLEVCEPSPDTICEAASEGVQRFAEVHQFADRTRLKLSPSETRSLLAEAARVAIDGDGRRAALWSALVNDAAAKPKAEMVERTPLCLLDVARTAFLTNLAEVCSLAGVGRGDPRRRTVEAIKAALLSAWRRQDDARSFRWDPVEDSRHAYRWTAPTDDKQGVEHGANILAAIGLPVLTVVPVQRSGDVRLDVIGGEFSRDGFACRWPIWREPASLSGIRALLCHPSLTGDPAALAHLGVVEVRRARRISVGKFMNFMRAEPVGRSG